MNNLARQLTAHRRFALVNGMCFETADGADWIGGIDADGNPRIFGVWAESAALLQGRVVDAYTTPSAVATDDDESWPAKVTHGCSDEPEPAWLKLDDPATFGALWSLLPPARWTLEMYAGRCGVYNSDDMNRRPGIGSSPGEAVARVLLVVWGQV